MEAPSSLVSLLLVCILLVFVAVEVQGNSCTDKNDKCAGWARKDECSKNAIWMLANCRKSCKNCLTDPCHNKDDKCPGWAKAGECKKNPGYMLVNCKRACKKCTVDLSSSGGDPPGVGPPGTGGGQATDCVDKHDHTKCVGWAKVGECAKNPKWMAANCKKSCDKKCGGVGTASTSGTSGSSKPGGTTGGATKPNGGSGGSGSNNGGGSSSACQTMRAKGISGKYWRTADMAIFVSPMLRDHWRKQHQPNSEAAMVQAIKNDLAQKLNEVYSYKQLNGIDIKFNMNVVRSFSQSEAQYIQTESYKYIRDAGRDGAAVASFCEYSKRLAQRNKGKPWDMAMYLVHKNEGRRLTQGAAGRTRAIGSACKTTPVWNCGIVHGDPTYKHMVYDKLFAHETGHLLGFMHPQQGHCRNGIMTAPGRYFTWSQCIKQKAKEIFNDDWVYPCMDYQCGQMPKPTVLPGAVNDAERKILDDLCTSSQNDGKKWTFGAAKGAKGTPNSRYTINKVLWENKEWWLARNICKGIPCQSETGAYSGVEGAWMNGKPCGVNKKCKSRNGGHRGPFDCV
ncbi:uncharacterized protein LOC141909758 [Tubulanus polymorphus]|uniref:uncharacterized protein LOC141909758 n=1 Tax=Tubulanus polymorphus TaxID=672921 RepID=UPI003DA2FDB5